jgi:hypothetical protein
MRAIKLLILLAVLAAAGLVWGQPPADKAQGGPPLPPMAPPEEKLSLEELLTAALKHSPDIQLAEAKLHEAEAELRKTRQLVLQRIIETHSNVEGQRQKLKDAEAMFQLATQNFNAGALATSELRSAKANFESAKLALKQAELALRGMTGKLTAGDGGGVMGGMPMGAGMPGMPGMAGVGPAGFSGAAAGGEGMMGGGGVGIADSVQRPRGSMADRVRKALDGQVKLDGLSNVPLRDVVTLLKEHTPGIPYLSNLGSKKDEPVTLDLRGEIQVGAFFQALQDVVPGLQVYVRDYGILLTVDDLGSPPVGAMGLLNFWRGEPKPQP